MDTTQALLLANTLSFVVYAILAFWYVVPWLKNHERAVALTPLLWIHAFRHVALQVFSAQRAGLVIPDGFRDQIAFGDLAGIILALLALIACAFARAWPSRSRGSSPRSQWPIW